MLTYALRALINNSFKESYLKKVFMENGKKKKINVLIAFFIPRKSGVKIFLKWIDN